MAKLSGSLSNEDELLLVLIERWRWNRKLEKAKTQFFMYFFYHVRVWMSSIWGSFFALHYLSFQCRREVSLIKNCCPLSRSRREIRLDAIGKKFTFDWIFFVSRVRGHAFATKKKQQNNEEKRRLSLLSNHEKKTLSYFLYLSFRSGSVAIVRE